MAMSEKQMIAYKHYRNKTYKGRYADYKASAKKRNILFSITQEEFKTFWQKPCHYCGGEIPTIGLDRINSSVGYVLENIVPCCSMCNTIKLDHDLSILNEHMYRMLKHQGLI